MRWCALCQALSNDRVCKNKRTVKTAVVSKGGVRDRVPALVDVHLRTCGAHTSEVRDVYDEGKKHVAPTSTTKGS